MSEWPSTLPAPMRAVSIIPGRRAVSNEYASGRRIVRNWGGTPADEIKVQLRIKSEEEADLNYFWYRTGMDGIWFTADWLSTMGYGSHKAKFLGYPQRKGVTKDIMDFSITFLVQSASLCIDPDPWPSAGTGGTKWSVENASYDSVSFDAGSQENLLFGIFFKSDGTKMYLLGHTNDTVYQYTLSTPWVVSSASYDSVSLDVSSQETNPSGIFFKPDGSKMYILGHTNDTIYQYTLSTPWVVNSASYDSVSFDVSSQEDGSAGLFFKSDGTKMYIIGSTNDTVYQYTLSTPWVVSSASYDSVSFSVSGQETLSSGLFFKPDGTKMYIIGYDTHIVYQYTLSTPWIVNSASYDSISFDVSSEEGASTNLFFKSDGTKMYIIGYGTDYVYQYSL